MSGSSPNTPSGRPGTKGGRPARRPAAVALSYDGRDLPRVVATGRGHVAEQILELAFANGVRVREDADLVEILAAVDVDSEIPMEAIVAVAEILTHVYKANGTVPPAPELAGAPGGGSGGREDEEGGA